MSNDKRDLIIKIANYIIDNMATIDEVSKKFNKSVSSIKKYINDDSNLKSIDILLYNKVKKVQKEIEMQGRLKGSYMSQNISKYKNLDEQIIIIAKDMIKNEMTLNDASITYKIPKSTLYERIMQIKDKELLGEVKRLFEKNKATAFNNKKILD